MEDLIYRSQCNIFKNWTERVNNAIRKYHYQWDEDRAKSFAFDLIQSCQELIYDVPAAANLPAFRCPYCHCDYIDYSGEHTCPTCGIKMEGFKNE